MKKVIKKTKNFQDLKGFEFTKVMFLKVSKSRSNYEYIIARQYTYNELSVYLINNEYSKYFTKNTITKITKDKYSYDTCKVIDKINLQDDNDTMLALEF